MDAKGQSTVLSRGSAANDNNLADVSAPFTFCYRPLSTILRLVSVCIVLHTLPPHTLGLYISQFRQFLIRSCMHCINMFIIVVGLNYWRRSRSAVLPCCYEVLALCGLRSWKNRPDRSDICFLAGCRKGDQTRLCLSSVPSKVSFECVVWRSLGPHWLCCFVLCLSVCLPLGCSGLVVNTSASDWLDSSPKWSDL